MSTIGSPTPDPEDRADERSRAWAHLRLQRHSLRFRRVTFDHPPVNTIPRRPSQSSPISSA